jgi:uncharacterized membrane protein YidH (DUF202 family)
MKIWDELTLQHKKYVVISISVGATIGLLSSIVAFIIISLIIGAGLTITGGFAFLMKSKYDKEEAKYRTWNIIFLTAIISAVICSTIAFFGLYSHQQGWI